MALAPNAARAVSLVIGGLFMIVLGAVFESLCAASAPTNPTPTNCGGASTVFIVFGAIIFLIGIAVGVASVYRGPRTIYPTVDPAVPPPVIRPVLVQQTIVQQTVEVRCRYCNTLNPVTATNCSACGAAL